MKFLNWLANDIWNAILTGLCVSGVMLLAMLYYTKLLGSLVLLAFNETFKTVAILFQ